MSWWMIPWSPTSWNRRIPCLWQKSRIVWCIFAISGVGGGPIRRREPSDLLVRVRGLVGQVRLVHREDERDASGDGPHGLDPGSQGLEGRATRDVGHGEDPPSPDEVGVLEQITEALLAHEVPDREVDLHLTLPGEVQDQLLLRRLDPQGRDVAVVELVQHAPPDEGRLPDPLLADEAHLGLELPRPGHPGVGRTRAWFT